MMLGFAQFDFDNFANFGFLDVGDRFGGGMGVKKRQRERENTGRKQDRSVPANL